MIVMLFKQAWRYLWGAVLRDWTTATPLPLYLRNRGQAVAVAAQQRLKRCPCGLLHDHPTRETCRDCEYPPKVSTAAQVVQLCRRVA